MNKVTRRVSLGQTLVAIIVGTACSSAETPGAPSGPPVPAPPSLRRIVVLGDSLAISPSRSENFPTELQGRLNAAGPGWVITNGGVSGDTTAGGVRRFDHAITTDTRILVLALGANDGLRGLDIATMENNLSIMIQRAQARQIRVLLCGMQTPPTHGWSYTVEYHRMFRRVAAQYGVSLVPFLLEGVALNPDFNGADAIHPNAAGARRIAETVWPYLDALVQQESAVVSEVR